MTAAEVDQAVINHCEAIIAEWQLLGSEGFCIRSSCRARMRPLREDEIAWLATQQGAVHNHRVYGRCTKCASFGHRAIAGEYAGQVSGEFWSARAPELDVSEPR